MTTTKDAPGLTLDDIEHAFELGFSLVPLPLGVKVPPATDWPNKPITTVEQARAEVLGENAGIIHKLSGTFALDVDDLEGATKALDRVGINLQKILDAPGPKIKSPRGTKPIYLLPEGVTGKRHALAWPTAETCALPKKEQKPRTIFELRAGNTQDVLPGSVHPSGAPYEWIDPPERREDIPMLPGSLLTLFQNWDELKPMMMEAAPGYVPPAPRARKPPKDVPEGESVIDRFNAAYSPGEIIERYRYKTSGRGRWVAPDSSSGIPGVVLLKGDDGLERVYSHHGSDLLNTGHAEDAFGAWCILEHDGDIKAAVKEAAQEFGMEYTSDLNITFLKGDDNGDGRQDHEADPERIAQEITDFPLEVYPERLVLFIKAAAAALPAPPDFLAVAMLAALGSAVGISREIKLKDSWREGGRFFVAIVADPGSKKSPALALATAPLKELQRTYSKKYREALEEYERKKQEYEKAKADKRGSGETPEPPGAEPELSQCLTTDATVEALMSLHAKNPRALMLYQDELSGWVSGMGQYKAGKGNDLQKWLSIWSGAQVIVNRKGKQAEVLDNPFINVAGCIPPDILPTLETSEGSDGFIDRILFCYPRGVRPTFNPDDDIPWELTLEYQKVFNALHNLEPSEVDGTPQPTTLEMTAEALADFTEWANDHHEETNAPGFDRRLRGAWAKLEGYCARFALVLHLTAKAAGEEPDERISVTSINKAAALTDYFKSHARRVYGQLKGDPLDKMLRTVYEYIDRQPRRRCTPRDLTRAGLPGCATAAGTKALLQKLTAAGLGRLDEFKHVNGRKGEDYVLADK